MRKISLIFIYSIIAAGFLTSCGPGNDQAKLNRLERQRDALNEEIQRLQAEIAQKNGANPGRTEPLAYVHVERIIPGSFQHFINVQGAIESDNNILVPSLTSGMVKKIHVEVGDQVTLEQLLAELDASVLESSIVELEKSLELATTIYEKRKRLWDKKIGSEIEYLQAKNTKEALEKKQATLQEQLKLTKITAPISGTVDEVLLKEGEMAAAGFGAFRIVQLSKLKVTASLAENYISKVNRGDRVKVSVPVLNREFDASIDAVSQVIDPNNRSFQVEVKIPPKEQKLKPNMLAVLTISDYANPKAITVPVNIVQETGAEKFLFVAVKKDGGWTAQRRVVHTGEDSEGRVEILKGVEDGEFVVTLGYQKIADGQPIAAEEGTR